MSTIKKRKYSRQGCIECKRRKIKCDEAKPACDNCQKVDHVCQYPDANAPKKPRKPRSPNKRRPEGAYETQIDRMRQSYTAVKDGNQTHGLLNFPQNNNFPQEGFSYDAILDDATSLINGLADFDMLDFSSVDNKGLLKPFHSNIILNSPHSLTEEELLTYLHDPPTDVDWPALVSLPRPRTSNIGLIDKIALHYRLSEVEVMYLKEITFTDLAFYIYPFGVDAETNPVFRILLEYCLGFKYLLYSVIALSASCLHNRDPDATHQLAQEKYTTICMRLLVGAFTKIKSDNHLLRDIEGLVLTVVVLAMIFADFAEICTDDGSRSWTSHLNGARDLLIKYNRARNQEFGPKLADSSGITLAKLMFFNYDWISKLNTSPKNLAELEVYHDNIFLDTGHFSQETNPQLHELLKNLGLLTPASPTASEFNLYSTLTEEVVYGMEYMARLIRSTKLGCQNNEFNQVGAIEISHLMTLVEAASRQSIIPGIKDYPDFKIPLDNPGHPEYPDLASKLYLPEEAYLVVTNDDGSTDYYSCCDMSQQLHVLFLYLKLFTTPGLLYLPRRHPMIRDTIKKTLKLMYFLKPKSDPLYVPENVFDETEHYFLLKKLFNFRVIMAQLPFRIISDLTDDMDDFERLELFFLGLKKLSNGSANFALERNEANRKAALERHARRQASGKEFDETDHKYQAEAYPVF